MFSSLRFKGTPVRQLYKHERDTAGHRWRIMNLAVALMQGYLAERLPQTHLEGAVIVYPARYNRATYTATFVAAFTAYACGLYLRLSPGSSLSFVCRRGGGY